MSLAICVFITWLAFIILSLIPKKLSVQDMVFLYFVNTIFELSIFTILHINLQWLVVSRSVEHSFADLTFRLFMIPIVFVITANILLYSWKIWKWVIAGSIIFGFLVIHILVNKLGILTTHHWNWLYTMSLYTIYAVFSSGMAGFIKKVDTKEVKVK